MIFKFACACGHTWQGRKSRGRELGLPDRCPGCLGPVTEAMDAAAEPIGVESDGPDPRAPELLAFGVNVEACPHRFVGVKITDGEAALRCTSCGSKVGEATVLGIKQGISNGLIVEPPSHPCSFCGTSHPLVAHYGTDACPVLAPKAAAVDAEITARVLGMEIADSREIDSLRDLRALVLRLHTPGEGLTMKEWASVVKAARDAMTAATFDPAKDSIETVFPTEEHACTRCHMVTHSRVGMGPPAVCPGCGRYPVKSEGR